MKKLLICVALAAFLCSCSDNAPNIFVVNIVEAMDGGANIEMVQLRAGSFLMGSNSEYTEYEMEILPDSFITVYTWERPVHAVTLDAFQISSTEITQEQYKVVMGTNPSKYLGFFDLPVEQVSWYDAVIFCNRLSEMTGLAPCYDLSDWECNFSKNGFRLPTEAEWEYACRGGSNLEWGSAARGPDDLWNTAWFRENSNNMASPVRTKAPNSAKLYDMQGNVWEWCNDFLGFYNCNHQTNPIGQNYGRGRVIRGGGWGSAALDCRPSNRRGRDPRTGFYNLGFRIVRR